MKRVKAPLSFEWYNSVIHIQWTLKIVYQDE